MLLPHIATFAALLTVTSGSLVLRTSIDTTTATPSTTAAAAVPTGEFITTEYITVAGVTNAHVTLPGKTIALAIPTCIQTITPDKNGYVPPGTCHALYDYYPSFGAAVLFSVLFGAVTILHIWQAAKYKMRFCWVLIMASIWELGSFITRAISTKHQQNVGIALVTELLVLLAPLWINAFDYMLLSRMLYYFLPTSPKTFLSGATPASILSISFVVLDLVSFVVQLIGGSLAGPTADEKTVMRGVHLYMGGIALQQFFIFLFLGLAISFHRQMLRFEGMGGTRRGREGWRPLLYVLYASLGLITIRIFFRLIEFSGGKDASKNPLPFHEAYFYIFDAVPMFFALAAMNVIHPGSILVGSRQDLEPPGLMSLCRRLRKQKGGLRGRDGWKEVDGVELGGERGSGSELELPPAYVETSEPDMEPVEFGGKK